MSTTDKNMRFTNRVFLDKFYRNSRNNIEDPIFTGFTFDIDTLNSPLFFSLCGDEYDESLRSKDGTNTKLSDAIEEKLAYAYKYHMMSSPDSYEVTTTYTKDDIGSDQQAGYGIQDKYYMDKPIYGAVDYIYMVDKVSEGKYVDVEGTIDLGSGTTTNILRDASDVSFNYRIEAISEKYNEIISSPEYDEETQDWSVLDNIPEDEVIKRRIARLEAMKDDAEIKKEHDDNKEALEKAKKEYEGDGKDFSELENKKKRLNELKRNVDTASMDVNKQINTAASIVDRCLKILQSENEDKHTQAKNDVINAFNDFCDYFNISVTGIKGVKGVIADITGKEIRLNIPKESENKVTYFVKLGVPTYNKIEEEIRNNKLNIKISDKDIIEKILFLQNVGISSKRTGDDTKDAISRLQVEVENITKKVYGIHEDGRLGTNGDPAGGTYKAYIDAENACYEDRQSQIEAEIDYLKSVVNNLKEVEEYRKGYETEIVRENPTMYNAVQGEDETDEHYSNRVNSRQTFEVPQTVYDMLGFIRGMKDITTKYPYTLQSISGLDEAYKKYFEVKDPYLGSGDDTISIECLDYLDLKVSSMFNKYFNAVYDHQYRRERVPINLRRFNCSIFVHDIRNFKNSLNGGEFPGGGDLRPLVEMALNYVSAIEFKFYDCEFIPTETGSIFENVSNVSYSEPAKTKFTFRYGNCVINFLPFEDLRKYLFQTELENIKPNVVTETVGSSSNEDNKFQSYADKNVDDGNFRRWFDKSVLGNVNNNDYRDYVRRDSSVAVDDHYKTTIVNDFANNSVVNKNQELTMLDDALRRIVVGVSASTGLPVQGVPDALNIGFIDPIINEKEPPVVLRDIGTVDSEDKRNPEFIDFLGNVNKK